MTVTLTPTPLGAETPGRARFGDGAEALPSIAATGLLLTYTTVPGGVIGMPVTYAIQQWSTSSLSLFYFISPAIFAFAINGDTSIPAPETIQYTPPPQIGSDLLALPIVQGYTTITWSWTRMIDAEIAKLMAHYDPGGKPVTIVYPNELGYWVQKVGFMQPIALGQRSDVSHTDVSITFTHLSSD
jgi:hypothetical protein